VHTTLQYNIEDLYKKAKDAGTFQQHFPDYDEGDIEYKERYPESIG
jgi:hypothetical protein